MSTVLKSWSLNLLEPSGPVQACNGTALSKNVLEKVLYNVSSVLLDTTVSINKYRRMKHKNDNINIPYSSMGSHCERLFRKLLTRNISKKTVRIQSVNKSVT